MKIAIYGGSFNPPHCGHVEAAQTIIEQIRPDKLLVIPASSPPHKELDPSSPSAQERLLLSRLAFAEISEAEVSDIELQREGKSYTADTVDRLLEQYPDAELILTMGTDMLLSFEEWYRFRFLLEKTTLAVFVRNEGEEAQVLEHAEYLRKEYGAVVVCLSHDPKPMKSTDIREILKRRMGASYLPESVYSCIIEHGYYGAKPELYWLREKAYAMLKPNRVAHVAGCESEAVSLANRWGEDPENAAEAGILHDITKKLVLTDQLILCEKYDIIKCIEP